MTNGTWYNKKQSPFDMLKDAGDELSVAAYDVALMLLKLATHSASMIEGERAALKRLSKKLAEQSADYDAESEDALWSEKELNATSSSVSSTGVSAAPEKALNAVNPQSPIKPATVMETVPTIVKATLI